jgi:hypothetical protein
MRMGGAYLDFCQCFFQPPDIARHDYDVRSFLRELLRDTLAHSLGGACDEDCLQRVKRGWSNWERLSCRLTLPLTSNLFPLKNPMMNGRRTARPTIMLAMVQ